MTTVDTTAVLNLPGHLGSALPGTAGPSQGLPKVEHSEPLSGPVGAGSHLADERACVPLPGILPSGEDALQVLRDLDEAERASARDVYHGRVTASQNMATIYQIRQWRISVLELLGWPEAAELVRDRMTREMAS